MSGSVYEATLCEINNDIAHIMKWDFVPNIRYEQHLNRYVLTGFPVPGSPDMFRIEPGQVKYLLHKMQFTDGVISCNDSGDYKLSLQRKHFHKHNRGYEDIVRVVHVHDRYGRRNKEDNNRKHDKLHNANILTEIDRGEDNR